MTVQNPTNILKFSAGKNNVKLAKLQKKLKRKVYSLSVLSGHNCPFAKECHSKAIKTSEGMRIKDGPHTKFRCFSASQEVLIPSIYNQREHNTKLLVEQLATKKLTIEQGAELISASIPKDAEIIRIHVGGDFKLQSHLDAWLLACNLNPSIDFYCYTKSIPFLLNRIDKLPPNFHYVCSFGGYRDDLIEKHGLKYAKVVYSEYEAKKLGLPIDHDDSHVMGDKSFALLLHGTQPKGSKAAKRWNKLKGKSNFNWKGTKYAA